MATIHRLKKLKSAIPEYPDDMFADTRMSLGEHIEELRYRMLAALKWLLFFLVFGFILDAIGEAVGNENLGIGKPMLSVITDPIESQARAFYSRRNEEAAAKKLAEMTNSSPEEILAIQEKFKKAEYDPSALTKAERDKLLGVPVEMPVLMPVEPFVPVFGDPKPGAPKVVSVKMQVYPAQINYISMKGETILGNKKYLSTLSAQEAFVVYFKVSVLCGIVLASPFIFYQFWAFVGAGLYPHEKKYVYMFFGPSLGLFIVGVLVCQFLVLPNAVRALLMFNEKLGFDPDIRLHEWLSLAIILPLVFGISFQTPLVMVFLNRLGLFSAADYMTKWRYACFIIAVFAAVITPTPDAITMLYLFVPMFGLYMLGILFCHMFPGFDPNETEEAETAEEVAV